MTIASEPPQQGKRPGPAKQWTRVHATKRLEEEGERASTQPTYRFSILLVEFEGLGDTADRLGYASEENVWRRALGFLVQDMSADDMCCRLSGDEFLLILPGKDDGAARDAMERLHRRAKPAALSREAGISINIGIASYPTHGSTVEQLLRAADETLHAERDFVEVLHAVDQARPVAAETSAKERRGARTGWRNAQVA
jgi:diguanylate cyclase (GGDEF)-like protein